jgi:hypothetical protein
MGTVTMARSGEGAPIAIPNPEFPHKIVRRDSLKILIQSLQQDSYTSPDVLDCPRDTAEVIDLSALI